MANAILIQVEGLEEIKKALSNLAPEIQKKVMDKAVRAQVVDWQKHAQSLAPVSGKVRVVGRKGRQYVVTPGNLRRNIRVKKLKSPNPTESRYGIVVGKRAFYWHMVEFGSRNNVRRSFLRNTFDSRAVLAVNNIAGDCAKFIAKYFKAQAKLKR